VGVTALAVLTVTLGMVSGQWLVASGQCVTGVTLNSGQWLVASGQGVTGVTLNSGQWLVASGQGVTGVTLNSGQWLVASGQGGVTGVTLTAGVGAALCGGPSPAGAELPSAREPQMKLGEEPADPAKEKAAAVARAKDHLVKRLKVRPEEVTLESATPATWPDASLGCPEKDRMYAQVVTSGYKVLLKVEAKTHEVHVAGSRVVSCPADH